MAQIETNIEAKNGKGVGFERIRRITGYLVGTLDRFNDAKRAEVRDLVSHTLSAVHPVLPDRQLHLE